MFNPYAAGKKTYGGGRSAPNIGPVDPLGYRERDAERLRKNAAMQQLKAMKNKNWFSADWMRVMGKGPNG
jgi:hypothetical protein